jgi:hypothetical protein
MERASGYWRTAGATFLRASKRQIRTFFFSLAPPSLSLTPVIGTSRSGL